MKTLAEILQALFEALLWPLRLLHFLMTSSDPAADAMNVADRLRAQADAMDAEPPQRPCGIKTAALMRSFLRGEVPLAALSGLEPRTRCWLLSAKAQERVEEALGLNDEDLVGHATGRDRGLLDEAALDRVWQACFTPSLLKNPTSARAHRVDRDDWFDVDPAPVSSR